jgi:hypothetical protein
MQDGIGQAPRKGNLHRARARYRPRFLCDQQNEGDDDEDHEDDCKVTPRASCPIVLVVVIDLLRWQTERGEDEQTSTRTIGEVG